MDAGARAPVGHGHHIPRRPSILAGYPGAFHRHSADCGGLGSPIAPALQLGNVGRGHLRHRPALPQRGSLAEAAAASRADPQYLLPDAVAGFQCGGVHQLPGWRGHRVHQGIGPAGHRHLSHFRFPEFSGKHGSGHGGGAGNPRRLRGLHLLYRRYPGSRPIQVLPGLLPEDGPTVGGDGRPCFGSQGHGGALQALRSRRTGESPAPGSRHSDSLPHPRHQRCERGFHPQGRRVGSGCRRWRGIVDERSDQPTQPQLHCGGLARPAAGYATRPRGPGRLLGLLGGGAGLLSALR